MQGRRKALVVYGRCRGRFTRALLPLPLPLALALAALQQQRSSNSSGSSSSHSSGSSSSGISSSGSGSSSRVRVMPAREPRRAAGRAKRRRLEAGRERDMEWEEGEGEEDEREEVEMDMGEEDGEEEEVAGAEGGEGGEQAEGAGGKEEAEEAEEEEDAEEVCAGPGNGGGAQGEDEEEEEEQQMYCLETHESVCSEESGGGWGWPACSQLDWTRSPLGMEQSLVSSEVANECAGEWESRDAVCVASVSDAGCGTCPRSPVSVSTPLAAAAAAAAAHHQQHCVGDKEDGPGAAIPRRAGAGAGARIQEEIGQEEERNSERERLPLGTVALHPNFKPCEDNSTASVGQRQLQASDPYEAEFFDHLRRREAQQPTLWGYIGAGMSDIGDEHRQCMVNWLYEVAAECGLLLDTFFLAILLMDRCLKVAPTPCVMLQLLGSACMSIAVKVDETDPPPSMVNVLVNASANSFSFEHAIKMEAYVLKTVGYQCSMPTPMSFFWPFLKVLGGNKKLEKLAEFFLCLSLLDYECLKFRPSELAASAVLLACCSLNWKSAWRSLVQLYNAAAVCSRLCERQTILQRVTKAYLPVSGTGYATTDLRTCVERLHWLHTEVFREGSVCKDSVFTAAYGTPSNLCVSKLRAKKSLPKYVFR